MAKKPDKTRCVIREGTLEDWETSMDVDGWQLEMVESAERADIRGLDDFLEKAEKLVEEMGVSGPLRQNRARRLHVTIARVRDAAAAGVHKSALYYAITAGLVYANLVNEKRFDKPKTRGKGFTRSEYFAAKKECRTRAELAERLGGISDQGLRKWEKANV